jgi:hypothetical protein
MRLEDKALFEGGNVFKDPKGSPATERISRENVMPTVQWLEQLTGLSLQDNMLGSTGRATTSGDLDLGVDSTKVSKDVLIKQLLKRGVKADDIKKSGDAVHLKTPILGDPSNGYVQTDFMFSDNPSLQQFALQGGSEGSQFKGVHRAILMASIAKAQNMKWSPKFGLVDRGTDEVITADPKEIAVKLLGQGHAPKDLTTVETIIKAVKDRPDFEQLVADAKENFGRDNLVLPESRPLPGTGAWYRQFVNRRI